jgi:transcriptional regulator with XRE-family HTH domain
VFIAFFVIFMNMNARFYEILKALNIRKKKHFAAELGLSPSALSEILNGKVKNISGSVLELLKIKFGINPTWLLTGEGDMFLQGKDPRKKSETNLDIVSGCAEEYPDINIITKIAHTGWWQNLTETEREIIVFMANIKNDAVKKKIRNVLEAYLKKEMAEDDLSMEVQRYRQKGAIS